MTAWPFVVAAYAVTLLAALAITATSLIAMRRAERLAGSPRAR